MLFETLRTYWAYILVGYLAFVITCILFQVQRRRGKIQCRIKTPIGEQDRWIKPDFRGNKHYLVFEKEKGKKPGWEAEFSNKSLIPRSGWYGLRHWLCIDIFPHATKAIEYNFDIPEASQPKWDKATSKGYIEAKILKQMGEGEKLISPTVIWIVVLISIFILILEILPYLGGRLRI